MLELVIFLLVVFGITNALVNSGWIFPIVIALHENPLWILRKTAELLTCHMCLGFWVAGTLSYFVESPSLWIENDHSFSLYGFNVLDAFMGSGFCWLISALLTQLGNIAIAIKQAGASIASFEPPEWEEGELQEGCGGCGKNPPRPHDSSFPLPRGIGDEGEY